MFALFQKKHWFEVDEETMLCVQQVSLDRVPDGSKTCNIHIAGMTQKLTKIPHSQLEISINV